MPLAVADAPSSRSTSSGTIRKVPCSTTVAPNTPATAAAKRPRPEQARVDAGCSMRSSTSDEQDEQQAHGRRGRRGPARVAPGPQRHQERDDGARRGRPGRGCPAASRSPARRAAGAGPAAANTDAAATSAIGTASENIDRQPNAPTSTPPMNGPTAALTDVSRSNRPNASPRRPGGAISRTIATELVETRAPLTACRTRAPSRTANDVASAASSDASAEHEDACEERRSGGRTGRRASRHGQRHRDRSEVEGDDRGDLACGRAELAHHAGQGDREHRRVQRDEDRAARHAEHQCRERRPPLSSARDLRRHSILMMPAPAVDLDQASIGDVHRCVSHARRRPAGRTRGPRRRRATGRRRCSSRGRRRSRTPAPRMGSRTGRR